MRALGNNIIVEPTSASSNGLIVNTQYKILSIGSLVPANALVVGARVLIESDSIKTEGVTQYCKFSDIIAVI